MTEPNEANVTANPEALAPLPAAESPTYEYVLTKQNFLDAQRVFRARYRRSALLYYLWYWVVPFIGLLVALVPVYYWLQHDRHMMSASFPLAGAGLYFALVVPVSRIFQIRRAWRNAVPITLEGKPVSLRFNHEWIASGIPGRSEGVFRWSAIYDFAEDEKVGLLLIRKKLFLFIPKPALPAEVWERIRELAPKEPQKHLF